MFFQGCYDGRVSGILVDIDDAGNRVGRRAKHFLKESLRRCGVTLGGEQKINRLPGGIDCSIQILFLPLDLNVSLVDSVAFISLVSDAEDSVC